MRHKLRTSQCGLRGFKFVKQLDSMQCGTACLAMICRHYGARYTISQLQEICSPTNEGVSLKAIADAATDLGLDNAAARVSIPQLDDIPLPAILHWNQNHFVVIYKISGRQGHKKYHIADPGKGKRSFSEAELRQHWISHSKDGVDMGLAMMFEPTEKFHKLKPQTSSHRNPLRFIFSYLKEYRKYFTQITLGLALGCILQLAFPFLTQAIVDTGIRTKDIHFIWLILLGELMIVAASTITGFIRRWLLLHISMRINISMVSDFLIKLMRLPMSFFDTKLMGDILQRINDHDRVQQFLTNQTLNVLFSILSFLIFGIVLLIYNPLICGIYMLGTAIYAIWTSLFLNRRKVLDYEVFEQQAINKNKTYQMVTAMQEIKLHDCCQRRRWEWEDVQADLFSLQIKALRLQQSQESGSIFINEIKNILVTVFAATAVISGNLTLGAMLAIQYIIGQLNSPVEQLMGFIYAIQDVKISLERINEIKDAPEEDDSIPDTTLNSHPSPSPHPTSIPLSSPGDIVFENVGFKYDRHAPNLTVHDISLTIPKGKVTAIVGASGSGKSTLIKLMLGYYPVTKGRITIGDKNISNLSLSSWRKKCGVVMQDGVIFSDTIRNNIAIGDAQEIPERTLEAARMACIHDYVSTLPLGYSTSVGKDGTGLSQGQKQRILIARAIYKDPEYIFLDEATNALDATNEAQIVHNLEKFYQDRTVVIVAHRLSTVRNADNIIVLDKGTIVEQGTHEELITRKGTYYTLIKNQLELGS